MTRKAFDFDFKNLTIKSRSSKGNILTKYKVRKIVQKSMGTSTLGGRKIRNIDKEFYEAGYNFINWDGKDKNGDNIANGVYLYTLKALKNGNTVSRIGKIAKYQ